MKRTVNISSGDMMRLDVLAQSGAWGKEGITTADQMLDHVIKAGIGFYEDRLQDLEDARREEAISQARRDAQREAAERDLLAYEDL